MCSSLFRAGLDCIVQRVSPREAFMGSYLQTAAVLLLALSSFRFTEAIISDNPDRYCFSQQNVECDKETKRNSKYVNVHSLTFSANFLCDTETDGGMDRHSGEIVILKRGSVRRLNHGTSFNRNWAEYKNGFGSVCDDYWLGNERIHRITSRNAHEKYELRIDMLHRFYHYFARYKQFSVDGESNHYALRVSGFNGNTRDELAYHNNMFFSRPDRDNDQWPEKHCAGLLGAGWWYRSCHMANLNGQFDGSHRLGTGVIWTDLTGEYGTLSAVEMKIRKL
ncbi:hypothetical protein Btru_002050 [Bulinus truncatus]|nr:hypothetical protein Btru_002050 [Bulinus truncatus]